MGKKVFLSYAGEDSEIAAKVAQDLQNAGLDIFDWRDPLKRGQRFIQRIHDEIREADKFVVFLSPAYLASKYCEREANFAIQLDNNRSEQFIYIMKVGSVNLEDAGFLAEYDQFDLTGGQRQQELERLIHILGRENKTMPDSVKTMPDYPDSVNDYKKIRIFVASTNDLAAERDILHDVVAELNRTMADGFKITLELLDWGAHTRPAMGRPQAIVFEQIPLDKWDVFIGILWYHFGTPPGGVNADTGEPFSSGTEEEFQTAYHSYEETGRPEILFYRCTRDIPYYKVDTKQVQQVQEFFAEFEALGRYPGLYCEYQYERDFERRVREDITRLLMDYGKARFQSPEVKKLAKAFDDSVSLVTQPVEDLPLLPFTNRTEELGRLVSIYAPPYFIIDAPAGYGKTELLKEVQKRFDEQGWENAYFAIGEYDTVAKVAAELAAQLDILLPKGKNAKQLGLDFGKKLLEKYNRIYQESSDARIPGVIFLLDVDKRGWETTLPTVNELTQDFILGLVYNLGQFLNFTTLHNPFRVILAGRYLAGKINTSAVSFEPLQLEPFRYRVVRDTIRKAIPTESQVAQLAAHLMFHTAGHPGCISRTLQYYQQKGYPPDDFFDFEKDHIWEDMVRLETDSVYNDIPRDLRRISSDISVFRYLDHDILRQILATMPFTGYYGEDQFTFADKLTNAYLVGWSNDGRLIKDSITRRLLALRLWREIGGKAFFERCQWAENICAEKLMQIDTQLVEKWAIERMFQYLQKHIELISNGDRDNAAQECRLQLRKRFFAECVPDTLTKVFSQRSAQTEKNVLLRNLEDDWEFSFTVKYYLRDGLYEPNSIYRELRQIILEF